ncbi:tyrosine-type recombinase/integrase [Glaesserella parasuis]|uniref:tyrosine-type recombinase/integrase n=1 Tax=Glaesserella parasuis TaxID=738 RepID=UPI003B683ED9
MDIIRTFRYTGIRRRQLVLLRVKDVSIERGIIMIPAHINKNHNYHEIPISNKLRPHIEKVIYEHKHRRSADDEQFFNLNKFSSYTLNRGQKMSIHQLQNMFVWIHIRKYTVTTMYPANTSTRIFCPNFGRS